MKALGGRLLARGRAFPPHEWLASPAPPLPAGDLLKYVLEEPGVCAVVAGVASPEEAEEDARAGAAPLTLTPPRDRCSHRAYASYCVQPMRSVRVHVQQVAADLDDVPRRIFVELPDRDVHG